MALYDSWWRAGAEEEKTPIWHAMLRVHADQVFTIGTVGPHPVVVSERLRNVPAEGLYSWDPGHMSGCTGRTRLGLSLPIQ